jgi:UDP-N-acetylglucosamine acyltransferase
MTTISAATVVHPTAIIENGAVLGSGVKVGPYSVIGPKAVIGDRTEIQSHVVITGRVQMGRENLVSSYASIGSRPQDLKFKGEDTELVIGDRNMFREYCNVSLGTEGGGGKTVVGNENLFMVYTHIAHDCMIGNRVIAANNVAMAGHVVVDDGAVLGGLSGVHQFCRIGRLAMIAAGAKVVQDVVPFGMVHGDRARMNGLNMVGLRRLGITNSDLQLIKAMYHLVFDSNLTLEDAIAKINTEVRDCEFRSQWLDFLKHSERGLCR